MEKKLKQAVKLTRNSGRLMISGEFDTFVKKSNQKIKSFAARYGNLTDSEARKKVALLTYKLTVLGYPDKALAELKAIAQSPLIGRYFRALAAWEIAQWLLNSNIKSDLSLALKFIAIVKRSKTVKENLGYRIQIAEARALNSLGAQRKVRQKMRSILHKDPTYSDAYLALANSYGSENDKLVAINDMLHSYKISPIKFRSDTSLSLFDRLGTQPDSSISEITDGPPVSVIMPAYNSETTIEISLKSVLNQSWRNLEVIVVDDKSSDNTAAMVKKYMKRDKRLSLIINKENRGAYFSRNTAIKKAAGEFITVFDADDWLHPERIALQVRDLQEHPDAIGNISYLSRATSDLLFMRRGAPSFFTQVNMSSLMLRRAEFTERFGYWDSVRFSADSEMYHRIRRSLGEHSIRLLPKVPLSFARQSDTSLTGSSHFGFAGFAVGARKMYNELYNLYQQEGGKVRYDFPMKSRPFYAPVPMRNDSEDSKKSPFDLIIVGDFRNNNHKIVKIAIGEIIKNKNLGSSRIGLIQRSPYSTHFKQDIAGNIRRALEAGRAEMIVYGESVSSKLCLIDPSCLDESQLFIPEYTADLHVLLAYDNDSIKHIQNAHQVLRNEKISQVVVCFFDHASLTNADWKAAGNSGYVLKNTWFTITRGLAANEYYGNIADKKRFKLNGIKLFKNPDEKFKKNISFTKTSDAVNSALTGINSEIVIIMPSIDETKALNTATTLLCRANMEASVIIGLDTARIGFISTLNKIARKIDAKYIVYLAEDAFPGRNWLKIAHDDMERAGADLFCFNDGKWQGRIASFGMVRTEWVRQLYDGDVFYPGYNSHGCDNELTVIARATNSYIYNPASVLIEYDTTKDSGGSNPYDYELFQSRFRNGFDGLVKKSLLNTFADEYRINNWSSKGL